MKILRVLFSADSKLGGVVEAVRLQQAPLNELGVDVEIVSCDSPDSSFLNGSLPVRMLGPSVTGYGFTAHLVPWLRTNAARFDAVIVEGIWQYHSFAVWRALSDSSTPYYVFTHGMLDPWFKRTYPKKHLKKWFYWPWAEYRVLRDARAVIFTCEEERLLARQSFWLYVANEVIATLGTSSPPNNDLDLKQSFLMSYPELQGKRIVLFLSRIHEKKGCDLLLEAFARVAGQDEELHLVMAGPNQTGWAASLQAQAERLGITHRITWPGMLHGDVKWGAFYAADVFCLPSHQENFGIVVAEALACGKPVLISNKVNIWREIESDKSGFIAEDSVEGTEANLEQWLALSTPEYEAMCSRAKQSFISRFQVRRAAERLIEIIKTHSSEEECSLGNNNAAS